MSGQYQRGGKGERDGHQRGGQGYQRERDTGKGGRQDQRNYNQRHKGDYDSKKEDRYQADTRGKYQADTREQEPIVDPQRLGLGDYAEMIESMPEVPEDLRFHVRDLTAREVLLELGAKPEVLTQNFEVDAIRVLTNITEKSELSAGIRKQLELTRLFQYDEEKPAAEQISPQPNMAPRSASNASGRYNEQEKETEKYLLDQFECVAVPARADFDRKFDQISYPGQEASSSSVPSSKKFGAYAENPTFKQLMPLPPDCDSASGFSGWFWVLHQGAPNIGEKTDADDFASFAMNDDTSRSRKGLRLNENQYIDFMYCLWRLALLSVVSLGIEDFILFPFGMGAFIRHLGKNDDRYSDNTVLRALRRRIADKLIDAIVSIYGESLKSQDEYVSNATNAKAKAKPKSKVESKKPPLPLRLHFCLLCVNPESVENHNVFVEAAADKIKDYPGLADLIKFRRNVDVLQLAHDLSSKAKQPLKVAVLNGANRKLFGNHWFASGARSAIDENLHRRSVSLTRAALLLNMETAPKKRMREDLVDRLKWLGGKVIPITEKSAFSSTPLAIENNSQSQNQKTNASQDKAPVVAPGRQEKPAAGGGGACMCCKRQRPEPFVTCVDGSVDQGLVLLEKTMTVEQAMLEAKRLPKCLAFCHAGPPTSEPVTIYFKSVCNVEVGKERWTTYLRDRVKPSGKPKAQPKPKGKANGAERRENGDQV